MTEERKTLLRAGFFLAALAVIAVGGNLWKSGLRVKHVEVEGTVNVSKNQVIQLADVVVGASMYDLDLTLVQQNVTSHYFIKSVVVERNLPGTIRISITERTPLAVLPGTILMYVDEDGVVLPPTNERVVYDLPVISGLPATDSLFPGRLVKSPDGREAIVLLWTLRHGNREMFHRLSEVRLRNGGDIVLYSSESGVPIIFGHGRVVDKLARLEAFWETEVALRGVRNLQYVDVRYEDQVIARWKGSAGVSS